MCLAIPGKIQEIRTENGLPMAVIDYSGARNEACLAYTPEAQVGDYVIVHAGFALQILNEDEARASLTELSRLSAIMEDDAAANPGAGAAAGQGDPDPEPRS